ncbi:hypothetical protein CDAR_471961 [Caerostris darwini]|uniref:Uncharacterized protein n=1 Tax=Caerostris darwini TaxID=1538125 RepID=A0AAV4VNE4_9ARAC|nr:hypothetical protein CDAR_471961 [Caerostris darwini]
MTGPSLGKDNDTMEFPKTEVSGMVLTSFLSDDTSHPNNLRSSGLDITPRRGLTESFKLAGRLVLKTSTNVNCFTNHYTSKINVIRSNLIE